MPFNNDEDEGTPCPIRPGPQGKTFTGFKSKYYPQFDSRDEFSFGVYNDGGNYDDDDDEDVEIELTTQLPHISTLMGGRNHPRRKTVLNEPPRRPAVRRDTTVAPGTGVQREKEEHSAGGVRPRTSKVSEREKGGDRERDGKRNSEQEVLDEIVSIPPPQVQPILQQSLSLPPPQQQCQSPNYNEPEDEEGDEQRDMEREDDAIDFATILQPQPNQLLPRRGTIGSGLLQQPRRPTSSTTGAGVIGPVAGKAGRRVSAWVEARLKEKQRQRAAQQQQQQQGYQQEIVQSLVYFEPQPSQQQEQHPLPVYHDVQTGKRKTKSGGSMPEEAPTVEDGGLVKSYLNAPPKRGHGPSRVTAQRPVSDGGSKSGKENTVPDRILAPYEKQKTAAAGNTRKAFADKPGGNRTLENKRPASTVIELGGGKKSKLSIEREYKKPAPPPHTQRKKSGSTDPELISPPQPPDLLLQRKRPSSPEPRFVSESDLEDEVSFGSVKNPLIRTSTGSNTSWDASPPAGRTGGLRLMKRRKISQESEDLNPAQAALAQQLAAKTKQDARNKEKDIIPPRLPGLAAMNVMNPILTEDIARVEMYEDSWLVMLEASVSQLVNAVFTTYEESQRSTIDTHMELRREMLKMYSTFLPLHKRIQASLAFGALSTPKDAIVKSSAVKSWGEDLGLRKRFMELFMDTYEIEILGIAMEVVVGRDLFGVHTSSVAKAAATTVLPEEGRFVLSMSEKQKAKLVEGFLERFIVNCEDAYANPPPKAPPSTARLIGALGRGTGAAIGRAAAIEEDWGSVAWGLRKTMLRALMLILVLDKTKGGEGNLLGRRCLFRKKSQYKSSAAVLHALARLMLPSLGDIARPLSHMSYTVEHTQYPLEEFTYTVDNLAVDMRNGVRLIRLIELLLYSTEVQNASKTDAWPLSKDIKFPAISRAHKLHNVTIALEALEEAGGNERGVKPEDIVDGYRERTVGLLWGIVARWGLEMGIGGLVDWSDLRKELWRLKKEKIQNEGSDWRNVRDDLEDEEEQEEERGYVALLKNWAKSIAAKKGLVVENLTTSFADGRVFDAIVEEYESYFPKKVAGPTGVGTGLRLEARLRELGCNSYFAGLFGDKSKTGKVFNRDFVIGGLAFLCSRFLPWSIKERAAISIQTAFRAWGFSKMVHRRIRLLVLAHDCAATVQGRERILNAVITIQRAFKEHLQRKLNRLLDAMIGVQCCIRGILMRRRLQAMRKAAVKIQTWWRGVEEKRYRKKMKDIVDSVVPLQAHARGFLKRREIDDLYYAVGIVGVEWLRITKGRRVRGRYLKMRQAAITIQKWYKRCLVMRLDREDFLDTRESVIKLQAFIRGKLVRNQVERQISAALVVQRWYRGYKEVALARLYFTETLWAAMVVQMRRRETLVARKLREEFIHIKATVMAVQSIYRENKARKLRMKENMKRLEKVNRLEVEEIGEEEEPAPQDVMDREKLRIKNDVITVQSLWRGRMARKQASPRLKVVGRRVIAAMAKPMGPGEDTIGGKTVKALAQLKVPKTFGTGLSLLNSTTKHSHECAHLLATDDDAMKSLLSQLDTITKQLPKQTTTLVNRTLTTTLSILSHVSQSPSARRAIRDRLSSDPGKDIFTALLTYLLASSKQPLSCPGAFMLAVEILERFVKEDEGVRKKLGGRWKWLEGMSILAKGEREREKMGEKVAVGEKGGRKGKVVGAGKGRRGKAGEAASDEVEMGRVRAEKVEEILGYLR